MSAADADAPLIKRLRERLREAQSYPFVVPAHRAELRRVVLIALVEWADDGLRTGQQLDRIIDAARDVL